jgi:hypothetical protein
MTKVACSICMAFSLMACATSTGSAPGKGGGATGQEGGTAGTGLTVLNCGTIITPAGPRSMACGHAVPNGATLIRGDAGGITVLVDGAVVATYPACACDAGMNAH